MKNFDNSFEGIMAMLLVLGIFLFYLGSIAVPVGIIYIIWHFAHKYW